MNPDTLVVPIPFGHHWHYKGMIHCETCAEENAAFDALGAKYHMSALDDFIMQLPQAQAYYARYTREGHQYQESLNDLLDSKLPIDELAPDPISLLEDSEAVEEWLAPLNDEQKMIIRATVMGYKPKDIAEEMGHKNSNMVRLAKYEAKRLLGVPINKNMRRQKKEEER